MASRINRIKRRVPSRERAKPTKPAPIPTTVVVGIWIPDSDGWGVFEWVGEGKVEVGDREVEDDIPMRSMWAPKDRMGSVLHAGLLQITVRRIVSTSLDEWVVRYMWAIVIRSDGIVLAMPI
jgi:hypothetical protein